MHLQIKIFVYYEQKCTLIIQQIQIQVICLFAAGKFCIDIFYLKYKNRKLNSLVREEAALRAFGVHVSPVG